ncbi:SDR family oxidoreductase [Ravibacter arvi]|uniref:SDR family oxidoreductase n=1 Tax=Ravibacter arvi TaxID=2051041 RepID=A0ABP8LYV5_9BACT
MKTKIAVITGPTSGIGKVTTLALAQLGFRLVLVARNEDKAKALLGEIGNPSDAVFLKTDLSDLQSVKETVKMIRQHCNQIDLLVNNAGLIVDEKVFSVNGIELTFASNHLGHFLLTTELIDLLRVSEDARIVHVSSEAHRFARFKAEELVNPPRYLHFIVYANSKLANVLFSNELAERYRGDGITSNALHPGTISSGFGGASRGLVKWFVNLGKPFFKNVEQGALTSLYLATSADVRGKTGGYYENQKLVSASRAAQNKENALKLWELSESLVRHYRA